MRQINLFKVDQQGFPIDMIVVMIDEKGVIIGDISEDTITTECPSEMFHKPRWTGTEWIEDMSQEEIDERMNPQPQPPTENDILRAQNKALTDRLEFVEDLIAEMAMMIYD